MWETYLYCEKDSDAVQKQPLLKIFINIYTNMTRVINVFIKCYIPRFFFLISSQTKKLKERNAEHKYAIMVVNEDKSMAEHYKNHSWQ